MKVHLIAIGGTGMGALAGLLSAAGHEVRGSDEGLYPPMSIQLAELRIPVNERFGGSNLDWGPDLVVVGNTCKTDHLELRAAEQRGLRISSLPATLAELFLGDRRVICVAGTHGKTTTSSLMTWVLHCAGLVPGFFIGGVPVDLGRGFGVGQPPFFVVEGDEYGSAYFDKRPKFVHYPAEIGLLTGVEFDHADIFADFSAVRAAFSLFVQQFSAPGQLMVAADSAAALALAKDAKCSVSTYRATRDDEASAAADWLGRFTPGPGGVTQLLVQGPATRVGPVDVPLTGAHNMANCVAVTAAAIAAGVDPGAVASALASFGGIKRRQELRGTPRGIAVIDDFAHHPTAVRETLRGLRGVHGPGRLFAIFEPRSSSSRRRVFHRQYVEALALADVAVVAPLFAPEKIAAEERLDRDRLVAELAAGGTEAYGPADTEAIVELLAEKSRPSDTIVIMSSGGFDQLVERTLTALT